MAIVGSILRQAAENPRLQTELIAKTLAHFSSSPTIQAELYKAACIASLGRQKAIPGLLHLDNLQPLGKSCSEEDLSGSSATLQSAASSGRTARGPHPEK